MNNELSLAWMHVEKWCKARDGELVRVQDHHEYSLQNDTIRIRPKVDNGNVVFVVRFNQESQPISRPPEFIEEGGPKTMTRKRTVEYMTKKWEDCEAILELCMRRGGWQRFKAAY